MGTEFDGDHLSWGINFMGIVCLGGQEVEDRKSGDQISSGPNALQPSFNHLRIKKIPFKIVFVANHELPNFPDFSRTV